MTDVTDRLRSLYRTGSAEILLLTSSGTGGLESVVQNLFSPGDEVIVPLAGFFSLRWQRLATAYGLTVHTTDDPWGTRLDPDGLAAALASHPGTKAVLLTHSETSTGVIQPIEALASVARDAGALVVVDVVSSLGAVPFAFDEWGIDVAVGGSQKPCRPARHRVRRHQRARRAAAENATLPSSTSTGANTGPSRRFRTRRTRGPAISVMQGLHAALGCYFQDGVEAALARHRRLSRAVKDGVRAIGLDLFGDGLEDNWTVTAIRAPKGSAPTRSATGSVRTSAVCLRPVRAR
jgi:aspartate aminotransferase-like enzyme